MRSLLYLPRLFPLLLILILGCSTRSVNEPLFEVEAIMESDPVKALSILDSLSFDSTFLKSDPYCGHLYTLLLAEAIYKNDLPMPEDSVLNDACEYFTGIGDDRRLMRCLYLRGRGQFQNEDYSEAVISANKVMAIAEKLRDTLSMARTEELIGDIYNYTFHHRQELKHAIAASELYRRAGKFDNYYFALVDKAVSYENNHRSEESLSLLDSLLNLVPKNDTILRVYILENMLRPLISRKQVHEALQNYDSLKIIAESISYPLNPIVPLMIANGMKDYGRLSSGLDSLRRNDSSVLNDIHFLHLSCQYYDSIGQKDSSMVYLRLIADRQKKIADEILNNEVSEAQIEYLMQMNKDKNTTVRYLPLLSFSGLLVIGSLFIPLFFLSSLAARNNNNVVSLMREHLISSYNKEIAEKGQEIRQLSDELLKLKKSFEGLSESISLQSSQQSKTVYDPQQAKLILKEQFHLLNCICGRYMDIIKLIDKKGEAPDKKSPYYQMFKNFGNLIEEFKGPEFVAKVEIAVNDNKDGLADRLKDEYKDLPKKDYKFILFTFAGLSYQTICLTCNVAYTNYYNHRSRLMELLKNASSANRQIFMDNFARQSAEKGSKTASKNKSVTKRDSPTADKGSNS